MRRKKLEGVFFAALAGVRGFVATNVDSLLLWSMEELAFLQNSRIGERAKRRKKLVAEEFQVLFQRVYEKSLSG